MRSNWKLLGWYIAGAGVTGVIAWSTPNPLPFLILSYLIVYFGFRIVDRLAYFPSNSGLQGDSPEEFLTVEIDYFHENAFKVWFVDGDWEAGRSFEMSGTVLGKPETPIDGLQIAERATVRIYTLSGWFDKARIGSVSVRGNCSIGLPVQLAAQVLDDLRIDCHQVVTIGFKAVTTANGKPSFPIYLFEVERPLG